MDPSLLTVILVAILVVFILVLIFELIASHRRKREVQRVLSTRVFMVSVPQEQTIRHENESQTPKDFKQIISVAEQMFASFASLYSANISNRLMRDQEQISFEIVSFGGTISFYVACPKMFEEMVEKQIHAYYQTANIIKVKNHNIFALQGGRGEFAAAELELKRNFVLPIKTYLNLESDSLVAITNSMSKLGNEASAAVQVIIRPTNNDWRLASSLASKRVHEGKPAVNDHWALRIIHFLMGGLSSGVSQASNPQAQTDPSKPMFRLTPMQESTLKVLNEKASKTAFETKIRIVTTGPDKPAAQTNLQAIFASFAQFASPEFNSFKLKTGQSAMVKDYILRRFSDKGQILNTEELASLYHLPNHLVETPNIRWLMAKELTPPANLPEIGTIIGKSAFRGVEAMIRIKDDDRRRHIFMIGKTGVGKTTLFTNMIEQDILSGKGCCFIDPLGDAIEDLLGKIPPHRREDVIVFDPSDTDFPVALNMLEYHSPEQRDFIIQECIEIFYKLFDPNRTGMVGPQWEHWFRNAALTIMNQPGGGTLIDIPRIFTDDAFRKQLVSYVTDPIVKAFWDEQLAKTADFHKSEMYNYFISKFGRFMTNDLMRNIIGQKKSSFDFRQIMDEGKILLINLSKGKIGEINSNLLGMVIVSKIQMSAFSRADIAEETRRDFYLYVDEFQNFTTDSFASILSEARKYHLNLNITNQFIAQLTDKIRDAVIGNAGTFIVYRIGAADAEFMAKEYPGVSSGDMTNLDRFNTYVKLLIDGTPSKPFSMKGIKSGLVSDLQIREDIRNLSRTKFCRPKALVDQEIGESLKPSQPNQVPMGANEPMSRL